MVVPALAGLLWPQRGPLGIGLVLGDHESPHEGVTLPLRHLPPKPLGGHVAQHAVRRKLAQGLDMDPAELVGE